VITVEQVVVQGNSGSTPENQPEHTQDTPEAHPATPGNATKSKPTPAERRAARRARDQAAQAAALEALDDQRWAKRRAVDDQRDAAFAREVAGVLELLAELARMTARRRVKANEARSEATKAQPRADGGRRLASGPPRSCGTPEKRSEAATLIAKGARVGTRTVEQAASRRTAAT
jgi:hypothetical protein